MTDVTDTDDRARLRVVADYQFGASAGTALFDGTGSDDGAGSDDGTESDEADVEIRRTTSGRPQQVVADEGRLVSFGVDGRFTLGVAGGRRLRAALDPPAYRVVVGEESEPFVREGRNAFAKFVSEADPEIRPGDEVLVVGEDDDLFGVGRAELPAHAMLDFETGMAVKVRDGAGE